MRILISTAQLIEASSSVLKADLPLPSEPAASIPAEERRIYQDPRDSGFVAGADFVEIKDPCSDDFEPFFQIYEEALPESERKSRKQVAEIVTRADYRVVVMKSGEGVLSFLIVFISLNQDVGLLEYMATARQARNQGLGAAMFKKAAEIAGARPLLVEVDSEREDSGDREIRLRRKSFYFRAGCRQVEGLDYLMPRVDGANPPMMDLLYCWKGGSAPPRPDLIRCWLETVYAEVYQRPKDDPAIERMMLSLKREAQDRC